MNNKIIFFVLLLKMVLLGSVANAQLYQQVSMNGFNVDVIANGPGPAANSTNSTVDGQVQVFKSLDWKPTPTTPAQTIGLPLNRIINSAVTNGVSYLLQDYAANNCIQISNSTGNAFTANVTAGGLNVRKLFVLATSGDGASIMDVTVTFTDDTTQIFLNRAVSDWFFGLNAAIIGVDRVNINSDTWDSNTSNPRIYEIGLDLAAVNHTKTIKSIRFARSTGTANNNGVLNVFAVSAEALGTCPSPEVATIPTATITTNSAVVNFTPPVLVPATGYNYEVRAYGLPGSGAAGFVTSGNVPANATTFPIGSLPHSQTLFLYMRSDCSATDKGRWNGPFIFRTLCGGAINGAFMENFDTSTVGSATNLTVPNCWTFLRTVNTGNGFVTSGISSSAPNSFVINNGNDIVNPYLLISPETNKLGNGTYRIRFKARGSLSNVPLVFGRMSDNTNAATFTPIGDPIVLSSVFVEYVIELPATTDNYFAFKHGLVTASRSVYIDDVIYEPRPLCSDIYTVKSEIKSMDPAIAILSWTVAPSATNTLFDIEWGLEGFTPGSGTMISGVTNNYELGGLTIGQTYSFRVRSNCGGAAGVGVWSNINTFKFDYCTNVPNSTDGQGIRRVVLGSNPEVVPDQLRYYYHGPLATPKVELVMGEITTGNIVFATGYAYGTNIWIDLNHNGVFEANELVYTGQSVNTIPTILNISLNIPWTNQAEGIYRMRIASNDGAAANATACGPLSWGHVVDIDVKLLRPCKAPVLAPTTHIKSDAAVINWTVANPIPAEGYAYEVRTSGAAGSGATGLVSSGVLTVDELSKYVGGLSPDTNYFVYVQSLCSTNKHSAWSVAGTFKTLCKMANPVINPTIWICTETAVHDINVVTAPGAEIFWYASLTTEETIDSISEAGTYYVLTTNAQGCMSFRVPVNVQFVPSQLPTFNAQQYFCNAATIADLVATPGAGLTIRWYDAIDSTVALPLNHALQNGGVYYVAHGVAGGCEVALRGQVTAFITPTPPVLPISNITMCQAKTFGMLQDLGNLPNATVKWYNSATATTPINPITMVSTGTYYASQTVGVCESDRKAIIFNVFGDLQKPAATTQQICGSGTVADLVASGAGVGAQYRWYNSLTSATPLELTTPLASGVYYVSQAVTGCESERRSVLVRVIPKSAPVVTPFVICGAGTVADLHIAAADGVSYKWYTSFSATTDLTQNTPLASGTYYVARVEQGCVSARAAVSVQVVGIPTSPTGAANQSFTVHAIDEATVSNLVMDQPNVVWYATYNDARNGTNPLTPVTALINGHTYYAVLINSSGCPSIPTAVKVDVTLGTDDFEKSELVYYPNPTADVLNIRYKNTIDKVIVYNLLGQKMMDVKANANEVQVDLSHLSSANYMIELHSGAQVQIIKVIKK